MLKRLSRRTFALWALPLALNLAGCLTRDSTGASSRLRATTPVVASYGDDYKIYYHWGDGRFLDQLINNHIPNHIFPGGEKAYGYYSDELYSELMSESANRPNVRGKGLYVAADPVSSSRYADSLDYPKLIEVIIDQKIAEQETIRSIANETDKDWYVIKKNKGVYFREFSAAGLSAEQLIDFKAILMAENYMTPETVSTSKTFTMGRYFINKVDAVLKNPPQETVRLLPPPEWIYGNDYKVYYHWGDADMLDRLTNTHIPNHIYPGEEKAYGYYSDALHAEIMQSTNVPKYGTGPGLYVSLNPITSIDDVPIGKKPKLIEVIVDKRVVEAATMQTLGKDARSELRVIRKNKGIYFREFNGAGFSTAQLTDVKEMLLQWNGLTPGTIPSDAKSAPIRYFSERVDAIIKNPPRGQVRMLPPREWVCPP